MIGDVESCPWQFGYASLGSQLVLAKRIAPPTPSPAPATPALPRDIDAEAVRDIPPTPERLELDSNRPLMVRAPPASGAPVPEEDADEAMPFEAGSLPAEIGNAVPQTPTDVPGGSAALKVATSSSPSAVVHPRDLAGDAEVERPVKYPRIFAVQEQHEDDNHFTTFHDDEIDELESYDFNLEDEDGDDFQVPTSDQDTISKLCFPFSVKEPELSDEALMELDALADRLEISRLRTMGVLIPAEEYDFAGETPKRLTTRMVRAWRDKFIDGQHVWLRRSRYVAREYAWLSPDRQDLFSPASSVLTVRLLPTLFMKWKDQGFVLCGIDIADAFLMVEQKELTQVSCVDAMGEESKFVLGRVLPGQRNGSQLWHESFSGFLRDELDITECTPYPCLLKAAGGQCILLLHVDDVLCLSHKSYLEDTLIPKLKSKYKISLDVLQTTGDDWASWSGSTSCWVRLNLWFKVIPSIWRDCSVCSASARSLSPRVHQDIHWLTGLTPVPT